MRLRLRQRAIAVGRMVVFLGCGLVSLFILASGYESIYNKAIPFVGTLASVDLSALSSAYPLLKALPDSSSYGQFGKFVTLAIPNPAGVARLSIAPPILDQTTWLARASTMHLLVPTAPLNGNVSTAILYCRASFRTLTADTLPAVGTNVFIDTDSEWRYVYRVTSAKAYSPNYPYIPSAATNKGKLIIFCNDPDSKANDIVEADVISVQGTTQ